MSLADFLTSRLALETLGWTLIHFIWQGIAIAILLALAHQLCHQRQATLRYALSCGAMALLIITPIATFCNLYNPNATAIQAIDIHKMALQNDVLTKQVNQNNPTPKADLQTKHIDTHTSNQTANTQHALQQKTTWQKQIYAHLDWSIIWVVRIWFWGTLLLSLRLITGWADVQTLKRQRTYPIDLKWKKIFDHLKSCLHIHQAVLLLESAAISSPMVIGWFKPVILMPTSTLLGLTQQQIETIIIHELAHIKRHDYLVNWIQVIVETLLFYHPAVWWISNRMRIEREHCCDDIAILYTGNAIGYARALAKLETQRTLSGVAASDGLLLWRVRRLLNKPTPEPKFRATGIFTLLFAITWAFFVTTAPLPADNSLSKSILILKQMCFDQDFEGGYHIGKALVQKHPKSAELFAWYVCALTRYQHIDPASPPTDDVQNALIKTRFWIKQEPDNGWAKFALAVGATQVGLQYDTQTHHKTLYHQKRTHALEALQLSKRLLVHMPQNIDVYWLHCEILNNLNSPEKTLTFIDQECGVFEQTPTIQTQKGIALSALYQDPKATNTLIQAITNTLKKSIETDPRNAHLHLNLARYLTHINQYKLAYPHFKKATELSPNANLIRHLYWQNIQHISDWSAKQKNAKIKADIANFLDRRGYYPGALLTVYNTYAQMGEITAQTKIKNRILNEFPKSMEAEIILFSDITTHLSNPHQVPHTLLDQIRHYISYTQHYNKAFLGQIYYAYWQTLSQSPYATTNERVLAAQGLLRFYPADMRTLIQCSLTLSDHTKDYNLAVTIAKQAIAKRHDLPVYNNRSRLYKTQQDTLLAEAFDALGWAYYKMGHKNAAIRELLRARLFVNGLPRNLYHLGQEAQTSGDLREAETFYRIGVSKNPDPTNPNHNALKRLEHMMASK